MRKTDLKQERGITLIALVVLIIVMIILALVTVNTAIDGGLFNYAKYAKEKTGTSTEEEKKLSLGEITVDGMIYDSHQDYVEGNVAWNKILETKTSPHPEQQNSQDIGVGTDGELVNLDLWNYVKVEGGWKIEEPAKNTPTYPNSELVNGAIKGTIPQYINRSGDGFEPVVALVYAFHNSEITTAPVIPNTVTDMNGTFIGCANLTAGPKIPNGVTNMDRTFLNCTNLMTSPKIPEGVTRMDNAFSGCTSLTTAPTIPSTLTNMAGTFSDCTNLTTAPRLPDGVTEIPNIFKGCTSLEIAPNIPEGVLNMMGSFSGCTNLATAPTIPSMVTSLSEAFKNCAKLTGSLVINSTVVEYYDSCLSGAVTAEGTSLVLSGNAGTTKLTSIKNTAGTNNNITVEGIVPGGGEVKPGKTKK